METKDQLAGVSARGGHQAATRYVASRSRLSLDRCPAVLIEGDAAEGVAALKEKELAISAATGRAQHDSPAEVIVHAEDGSAEEEKTV